MTTAAIILAAGTSSRYRAADPSLATKLVADWGGAPLVRHVARAALGSRARPVVAVTGHARAEVGRALSGLALDIVHNPDFAQGLSTSLTTGLSALGAEVDGALVLLGDMPGVSASLLDRLIGAFEAASGIEALVPVHAGRRGNPALLGRALFGAARSLTGDEGARRLLLRARVLEITIEDPGVAIDIDDPDALHDAAPGPGPAISR